MSNGPAPAPTPPNGNLVLLGQWLSRYGLPTVLFLVFLWLFAGPMIAVVERHFEAVENEMKANTAAIEKLVDVVNSLDKEIGEQYRR